MSTTAQTPAATPTTADPLRRTSRAAGIFYLITFVSMPTLALYQGIRGQADFVARVPEEIFPQKDALVARIWRSYESGYWRRDRLRKEREDWVERVTSRMQANSLSAAQSQNAP